MCIHLLKLTYEVGSIMIFILEKKKLKHRELKLAQDYTAMNVEAGVRALNYLAILQ